MGFLREWLGRIKSTPTIPRDDTGRAPLHMASVGYVVIHSPAGIPPIGDVELQAIEDSLSNYLLRCSHPMRVVVVQAQIEGVG